MKRKRLLWLDNTRNPWEPQCWQWIKDNNDGYDFSITWVKSFDELKAWVNECGAPDVICFDIDLGYCGHDFEITGEDCVNWICAYCKHNNTEFPLYTPFTAAAVTAQRL